MHKILKGAFAHIKNQTVPLVAYDPDGTRIVIGEATVTGDDKGLKVVSTKIEDEKYKSLLETDLDEFSINGEIEMSLNDNDLIGETDAQVWAKRWLEIISENPSIPTDEGTMVTWFANAIMAGHDEGRRLEQRRDISEKLREIIFQAAGAATAPLLKDNPTYVFPTERVTEAIERVCSEFGIPKKD